jgi:hypothetical protein
MPSEMMKAGAPFSVGKFSEYSASKSDHGISSAIFTQRLSDDNLPPKGSSNSGGELRQAQLFCTRSHWVCLGFCTILPVYLAHFSRSHDRITRPCNLSALIQQALCRKRNSRSIRCLGSSIFKFCRYLILLSW